MVWAETPLRWFFQIVILYFIVLFMFGALLKPSKLKISNGFGTFGIFMSVLTAPDYRLNHLPVIMEDDGI